MPSGLKSRQRLLQRLLTKDTTLWSEDEAVSAKIEQRLGWLDTIRFSRRQAPFLLEFAQEITAAEFDQAILLGMGGSSLAAEVFRRSFPARADQIQLVVLDTTFPDVVDHVTAGAAQAKPLFIVSSKSGTTAETTALREHFWHWCRRRYGDDAGGHFIAITDGGSALHRLAEDHGYRHVFLNPSDIGGRYSALSLFGLVPACLLGVDLATLLDRASAVFTEGKQADLSVQLGEFIGQGVIEGRDKLTLDFSEELEPLAAWIEQLVSESTGKDGTGVVTVLNEPVSSPARYGNDRIFVGAHLKQDAQSISAWQGRRAELEQLGHPCRSLELQDNYDLGAEFARWQIATSITASIMGVNPFDEPDVNASKEVTRDILRRGPQSAVGPADTINAQADEKSCAGFFSAVGAPDYIVLLAYLPDTSRWRSILGRLRDRLALCSSAATMLAFGPRYLHSSGQLHKGGTKNGHFLVLTATASRDLPIPGEEYGFQHMVNAQALGDIEVLKNRGQKVMHVELGHVDEAADIVDRLRASLA